VFLAVVALLVGYPVYVYLDSVITGGIKDVGNGFKEVDLKAMSTFPFDQQNGAVQDIPEKWRALDGQKVVLYGEMWEAFDAANGKLDEALTLPDVESIFVVGGAGIAEVLDLGRSR